MSDDVTLFGKLKNKLIDSKQKWAESGRLLTGKTAAHAQRLPPGQRQVENWPVLDLGIQPEIPTHAWRLFVDGEVENPTTWKWGEFTDLPKTTLTTDIHCVTAWSRYDNRWQGVRARDLLDLVLPQGGGQFALFQSYDTYTTNLPLAGFAAADGLAGGPIGKASRSPSSMAARCAWWCPKLYFWKSAKWVKRIQFTRPLTSRVSGKCAAITITAIRWLEQRYDEET